MLTPNAINKIVVLEMIFWSNNILPESFVIKFFFQFSATGDKFTFSAHCGGHVLFLYGKIPKNWQDKWLRVNQERVGHWH